MIAKLWKLLHLILWLAVVIAVASQFALPIGVLSSVFGTIFGYIAGGFLSRSRLRGLSIFLLCTSVVFLGLLQRSLLLRFVFPSSILGSSAIYAFADIFLWFLLPMALVALVEAMAGRRTVLRSIEISLAAISFAAIFAAHREGFINRPFAFVDPIWSRGEDPLGYFLLLGVLLTVLIVLILSKGSAGRRTVAGILALIVLLIAIYFVLPKGKLKNVAELHRIAGSKEGKAKPDKGKKGKSKKSSSRDDKGDRSRQENKESTVPESFSNQEGGQNTNAPVAVVIFHKDYEPPGGYYYFRETAFSTFNGIRLIRDVSGRYDRDVAENYPIAGRIKLQTAGQPVSVLKIPGSKKITFVNVPTTVALLAPHSRPFGLINTFEIDPAKNPDSRRFFRAYSVVSHSLSSGFDSLIKEKAGGRNWKNDDWRHYTEGSSDPRYEKLAGEIVSGLRPDYRENKLFRAIAIKLWLDKHGTYSLESDHSDSADPVSDFLFGDITGHCVYFAHAACLLYRAAGVPARVAAGYAVRADYTAGGASLLIRSREAHAWPEICLEDTGWITLDISPQRNLAPREEAPDRGLQRILGEMAMKAKPSSSPPSPDESSRPSVRSIIKSMLKALLIVLVLITAGLIFTAYAVKLWRRWIPFAGGYGRLPVTAYRACLDILSEAGIRRYPGESRNSLAQRVGARSPAFSELTDIHLRYALGKGVSEPTKKMCLSLYSEARSEIRTDMTRSRKWLALVNPVPWWGIH